MAKKIEKLSPEEIMKIMEDNFGKGVMMLGSDKEAHGVITPSSSYTFNEATGIGGFSKKKIYDIYADPSAGKSSFCYDAIGNAQKSHGSICLLIDKEDAYSAEYGAKMGIDNSRLIVVNNRSSKIDSLEDMYEILLKSLEKNLFGMICVDSVTSFAPKKKLTEGTEVMGLESRINSDKMRLINNLMPKSDTILCLLRQTRSSIGCVSLDTDIYIE